MNNLKNETPCENDVSEILYKMKLLEFVSFPDNISYTYVQRVPGGWIFYSHNKTQTTFIPFNNEFQKVL